jgi:hypothetical protein
MNPKRRLPCAVVNTSVMKDQKTEITKRLNTDVQTKNTRPAHTAFSTGMTRNST